MIYPSVGQYTEAIKLAEQSPEDYFATKTTLRPVLGADGNPVMSGGNFAVVFKMQDTDGKIFALKCFTRDQEGRNESYRLIADELQYIESEYLTKIQYLEKELFVDTGTDDTEFPVLLMDWVEGETLDKYIKNHISEPLCLELLACDFAYLVDWLLKQPFAHGDLKPDNIIVKDDGSLVIVDYDGMFVPKMRGQKARELGSPDFRHPQRTEDDFDEHIDDFAIVTLLLTIKAIALNPNILEDCNAKDCVLLHTQDFSNLAQSAVNQKLQELIGDKIFARIYAMFVVVLAEKMMDDDGNNNLSQIFHLLDNVARLNSNAFSKDDLSTEVTDDDIKGSVEDEFGVKYSKNGKKLLRCGNKEFKEYVVKDGTLIICDDAFRFSFANLFQKTNGLPLQSISIPYSVTSIGKSAFYGCASLKNINIPNKIKYIGECAFKSCSSLQSITIPDSVTSIGDSAYNGCKSLRSVSISKGIKNIGNEVFKDCESLQNIIIPENVANIGSSAFNGCVSLQKIVIPKNVTSIGDRAFKSCVSLQSVTISDSVTTIGNGAFYECSHLQNIRISNNISIIGINVFRGCSSLQNVSIPNSVAKIGDGAFYDCKSLQSITIYDNVTFIGSRAFEGCSSLIRIILPDSIEYFADDAFYNCPKIQQVLTPDGKISRFSKHILDHAWDHWIPF